MNEVDGQKRTAEVPVHLEFHPSWASASQPDNAVPSECVGVRTCVRSADTKMKESQVRGLILRCLLGVCAVASSAHAEESWFYSDLTDATGHQIEISATAVSAHRSVPARVCTDPTLICLEAEGFEFAVTRNPNGPQSWRRGDNHYEVKKVDELSLLGRPLKVSWILQTSGDQRMTFLYSWDAGLVGFSSNSPKGPLFLLETGCGFGASERCAAQYSPKK